MPESKYENDDDVIDYMSCVSSTLVLSNLECKPNSFFSYYLTFTLFNQSISYVSNAIGSCKSLIVNRFELMWEIEYLFEMFYVNM